MADEQKPWATIIIIAPSTPIFIIDINPTITRDMWTTEEYAITTFISLWERHKIPKIPPPNNDNENKNAVWEEKEVKQDTR